MRFPRYVISDVICQKACCVIYAKSDACVPSGSIEPNLLRHKTYRSHLYARIRKLRNLIKIVSLQHIFLHFYINFSLDIDSVICSRSHKHPAQSDIKFQPHIVYSRPCFLYKSNFVLRTYLSKSAHSVSHFIGLILEPDVTFYPCNFDHEPKICNKIVSKLWQIWHKINNKIVTKLLYTHFCIKSVTKKQQNNLRLCDENVTKLWLHKSATIFTQFDIKQSANVVLYL